MPIRLVNELDSEKICEIYNEYVQNTTLTFECNKVSVLEMRSRITKITRAHQYLVYEQDNQIVGYAYLDQYRHRCAYTHVAESSIYIDTKFHGQGIGEKLYRELLSSLQGSSISEIIAVIALPNLASERLHEKLGFRKIGTLNRMGFKFGKYIDTAYWQKSLP